MTSIQESSTSAKERKKKKAEKANSQDNQEGRQIWELSIYCILTKSWLATPVIIPATQMALSRTDLLDTDKAEALGSWKSLLS